MVSMEASLPFQSFQATFEARDKASEEKKELSPGFKLKTDLEEFTAQYKRDLEQDRKSPQRIFVWGENRYFLDSFKNTARTAMKQASEESRLLKLGKDTRLSDWESLNLSGSSKILNELGPKGTKSSESISFLRNVMEEAYEKNLSPDGINAVIYKVLEKVS